MDYLQTIVRRFKTKNVIPKPTSRLLDIFDWTKYRYSNVSHKQISHIMKYIKWYMTEVGMLFNKSYYLQPENVVNNELNRYEQQQELFERLIEYINQYRMGYSTMLFLIKQIERKDYYKYRNIILTVIFTVCRQSFLEAVIESKDEIDVLVQPGNDICLYDFYYKIIKNSSFLT